MPEYKLFLNNWDSVTSDNPVWFA